MGQALCELLRTPDKCRDALRVTLHLVSYSRIFSMNVIFDIQLMGRIHQHVL